jgi:hypothetical protein
MIDVKRNWAGVTITRTKLAERRKSLHLSEPEAWDLFKQLSKLFRKEKPK